MTNSKPFSCSELFWHLLSIELKIDIMQSLAELSIYRPHSNRFCWETTEVLRAQL